MESVNRERKTLLLIRKTKRNNYLLLIRRMMKRMPGEERRKTKMNSSHLLKERRLRSRKLRYLKLKRPRMLHSYSSKIRIKRLGEHLRMRSKPLRERNQKTLLIERIIQVLLERTKRRKRN